MVVNDRAVEIFNHLQTLRRKAIAKDLQLVVCFNNSHSPESVDNLILKSGRLSLYSSYYKFEENIYHSDITPLENTVISTSNNELIIDSGDISFFTAGLNDSVRRVDCRVYKKYKQTIPLSNNKKIHLVRWPKKEFVFNKKYFADISSLTSGYTSSGKIIKSLYTELSSWDHVTCVRTWFRYVEDTYGVPNGIPDKRDDYFIAYLYAKQTLKFKHGYLDELDSKWKAKNK